MARGEKFTKNLDENLESMQLAIHESEAVCRAIKILWFRKNRGTTNA